MTAYGMAVDPLEYKKDQWRNSNSRRHSDAKVRFAYFMISIFWPVTAAYLIAVQAYKSATEVKEKGPEDIDDGRR